MEAVLENCKLVLSVEAAMKIFLLTQSIWTKAIYEYLLPKSRTIFEKFIPTIEN